jgi:hypothetical protein
VVADEPVAVAEHEREADCVKKNAAKARVHDAFHQHVYGLARAAEARLQHGEAHLHAEDQKGRHQRPRRIHRIHNIRRLYGAVGREDLREEQGCDHRHDRERDGDAGDLAAQQSGAVLPPCRLSQTLSETRNFL